ncbi:hypothetical protein Drorol1_Dr00017127 [Drosera rotundifolia]
MFGSWCCQAGGISGEEGGRSGVLGELEGRSVEETGFAVEGSSCLAGEEEPGSAEEVDSVEEEDSGFTEEEVALGRAGGSDSCICPVIGKRACVRLENRSWEAEKMRSLGGASLLLGGWQPPPAAHTVPPPLLNSRRYAALPRAALLRPRLTGSPPAQPPLAPPDRVLHSNPLQDPLR